MKTIIIAIALMTSAAFAQDNAQKPAAAPQEVAPAAKAAPEVKTAKKAHKATKAQKAEAKAACLQEDATLKGKALGKCIKSKLSAN